MSNQEIINQEVIKKGFEYTGDNLYTYGQWMQKGYNVKRGERAFIKTRLWSTGENKRLKPSSLFKFDQVLKVN